MRLLSFSWSHKSGDAAAREALAAVSAERVLAELKSRGVSEAAVLSTCNRFELYAAGTPSAPPDAATVLEALTALSGFPLSAGAQKREGRDAVTHLFTVASGLDSIVIGETEILGQVKVAYETAKSAGMTGKRLNVLFQRALYVGKKVRTETGVAAGSSSVPSVAIQLAESIFGDLKGRGALVLGAGAMAELAAKHLVSRGGKLTVANRTWDRAYQLAARFGGEAARWESFESALDAADVVISSTGAPTHVVTHAMVEAAMARRGGRALFLIDIAMPRDIDESVHGLDNVFLYRLEDLEGIVAKNMEGRSGAMEAARRIVNEKAEEFGRWGDSLSSGKEISFKHTEADS